MRIHQYLSGSSIDFNHVDGFYDEDVILYLSMNRDYPRSAEIVYTLDGSEPTTASEHYKEPLVLSATDCISVITVRAAVCYKEELDEVVSNTYVLGKNVYERYSLPVVSIVSDDDGLYGYENGIMVPGKLYDDYVSKMEKEGKSVDKPSAFAPANFNEAWTRNANVTVFMPDGKCVINQQVGLSLGGTSTRENEQKTLVLEADEDYDKNHPRFLYDFWREDEKISEFSKLESYKKIKLRSYGQDIQDTMLRTNAITAMAEQAGLTETPMVRPAVVYLNNEYYGMTDLQPTHFRSYLSELFSISADDIECFKGTENDVLSRIGYSTGDEVDVMTEEGRELFEGQVDIDNLLLYYAIEMIINNNDWPDANVRVWRYTGEEQSTNPYTDGRLRFLLCDVDITYNISDNVRGESFTNFFYHRKNGVELNEYHQNASLLPKILEYEPYRIQFVNILCDLLSTSFSEENVTRVINESCLEIISELPYLELETKFEGVRNVIPQLGTNIIAFRDAAVNRVPNVYEHMWYYFGAEALYKLQVIAPKLGNTISFSTITVYGGGEDSITNRCTNFETVLTAQLTEGQSFSCWLVNGERVYEKELVIDERWTSQGEVSVALITEDVEGDIIIEAFSADGEQDNIVLYNPTKQPIYLYEYYLSDSASDLMRYHCPDCVLLPQQSLRIDCSNNREINQYITNFSLKKGETLYLFSRTKQDIVDWIWVPDMTEEEIYTRYLKSKDFMYTKRGM